MIACRRIVRGSYRFQNFASHHKAQLFYLKEKEVKKCVFEYFFAAYGTLVVRFHVMERKRICSTKSLRSVEGIAHDFRII